MDPTLRFTKKDFYFSVVTGLITGFSVWRIFEYLSIPPIHFGGFASCFGNPIVNCDFAFYSPPHWHYTVPWAALVVVIPLLWILGVSFGYFLGRWLKFFNQFGKFAAIGFTNGAVDFGVLNLLIANTGISSGWWYSVFKGISFLSAIVPSYFWNKYWAFSGSGGEDGGSLANSQGFQFAKFMSVAIVAILINTTTASLVVNYTHPLKGLSTQVWANIGAVAGSAVAMIFTFVGFKVAVFKK